MTISNIPWCHSTIIPVMGCDGCERWSSHGTMVRQIDVTLDAIVAATADEVTAVMREALSDRSTFDFHDQHRSIPAQILSQLNRAEPNLLPTIAQRIRAACTCYGSELGALWTGQKCHADVFEHPTLFPGRMAMGANWGLPTASEVADKPWLLGLPRLICISDVGDALSANVPFEFLKGEIIEAVTSPAGQRHIWPWLSKWPERMAEFADWLQAQGILWPENLVAMTTVTSQRFATRVEVLRRVSSAMKGLYVEPLFEAVKLDLRGIDWVIVGGDSYTITETFHVEWALDLLEQCKRAKAAFFFTQLGCNHIFAGAGFLLKDTSGGDWSEWPSGWRVRQMPEQFSRMGRQGTTNENKGRTSTAD